MVHYNYIHAISFAYIQRSVRCESKNMVGAAGALVDRPLPHRDAREPVEGRGRLAEAEIVVLQQCRLEHILQDDLRLGGRRGCLEAT